MKTAISTPRGARRCTTAIFANTALPVKTVAAKGGNIPPTSTGRAGVMEVIFRRDPLIYDGSKANNAWLQETPKPITNLCWDNAVLISPNQAKKSGLETGDIVEIDVNGRKVNGPIWPQPGHPDNSITVFLGYGRTKAGRVGTDVGFSGYKIRSSECALVRRGADQEGRRRASASRIRKASSTSTTPICRASPSRCRTGTSSARRRLTDFIKNPNFAHEGIESPRPEMTLYTNYQYTELKWGMTIDMNSCVGCKTCIVACQAENNIPVVGKEQTMRGRQMQWLRVDVYYEGGTENPTMYYQPMPCQQCENAPCEVVCPVGATVHSTEGLNDMVYNRCVGTRYCSNNCPYKVRRFNFLLFQDFTTPQFKMMRNPEVSVRSRGVMEKCTYCVQRITHGRITAEKENRKVRDGEVITACQQACPAGAIVFGDLNDPESRVSKLKAQQRNYQLLEDLNTRPRTTYMAVVQNINPELEQSEPS